MHLPVNANILFLQTENHVAATKYLQHAVRVKGFTYCLAKNYNGWKAWSKPLWMWWSLPLQAEDLSVSEAAALLRLSHTATSRFCRQWQNKQKTHPVSTSSMGKNTSLKGRLRRMAELVRANRKSTTEKWNPVPGRCGHWVSKWAKKMCNLFLDKNQHLNTVMYYYLSMTFVGMMSPFCSRDREPPNRTMLLLIGLGRQQCDSHLNLILVSTLSDMFLLKFISRHKVGEPEDRNHVRDE